MSFGLREAVPLRPVQLADGPLRSRAAVRPALRRLSAMAIGFAGGWAMLYGQLSPFGLGFALGLGEDCFAAGAVGAVLAVLARGMGVRGVCLVCAIGAAVAARWLWPKRLLPAMLAGCGTLLCGAMCFASGEGVQLVLYSGADALLAAAIGAALHRSPPEKAGAGTLLAAAAVAAALGGIGIGPINIGIAACTGAALALCWRGSGKEAMAFSAITDTALCAANSALAPAAVGLACAACSAAVLAPARRVEGSAAFCGGYIAAALCVQPAQQALALLASAGIGMAVLWLLPRAWLAPDTPCEAGNDAQTAERPRLSAAATRLEAAAQSLSSLAGTVNDVYDGLPHKREDFSWVIDNTHDAVCANCGRRKACWQDEYTTTMEGMQALRPLLEQQSHVEPASLPGQLSRCIHPAAMCAAATRVFALYRNRQTARVHAEAMRTALTEQYSAVAEALSALGEQLSRPGSPEPYKSGRVAALFTSLGTPPLECSVTLDDLGRTRAAVTLPRTRFSQAELDSLAQEVGRICRRPLAAPQKLSCKGITTLLFCEKPCLRAVFGAAGAAAKGEISGDAVQQFCSPAAAQMVLCDGMGTGRPAALDGNLAAELTARLLKAGFAAELAARLVNVALALKSDDESGATLDLISVDLYTGTARLFKAGAAPGFIIHCGRVRTVGEASLPMGILGSVNGQSYLAHLAAGDYAVLVSDGLLVDGAGWVTKQLELSAAAADTPANIAQTLVQAARVRSAARPDDITAAVLRLENC